MKKRILSLILSAAVLLSAGCSSGQTNETTTTPANTTTTTTTVVSEEPADGTEAPETTDPSQYEFEGYDPELTTSEAETEPSPDEPSRDAAAEFYDGPLTPAVWKVTDPESGNSMHMMGTIHIIPDREPVVPDYVTAIYEASDGIAVEYDTTKVNADFVVQLQYISYFVLSDGTTIDEHLSADVLERAREKLRSIGYDPDQFIGYNAAYWESLLSSGLMISIDGMRQSGIDVSFIMKAKQDGKEVRSIEALETQLSVLTMLSDEYYEWSIGELLEMDSEELEDSFRELYAAWAAGDTTLFDETEEEEAEEVPFKFAEEYAAYTEALLQNRNVGMAEKAAEYIGNGDNLLYMVGFGHFCGEGNVLELLEEKGFTVERIY